MNIGDSRIYGITAIGETELLTRDDVLPGHGGQLIQFVGMGRDLVPHTCAVPAQISRLLVTSDGIHGYAEPILSSLIKTNFAEPRMLVDRLTHFANWCGGADNATCLVAIIDGESKGFLTSESCMDLWTPGVRHSMPWEAALPRSGKPRLLPR